MPARLTFTEAELADMAGSLAAGIKLEEVARRYACAASTVRDRLIAAGLHTPRAQLRESELALIEDLAREGWTVAAIAEHIDRSTEPIRRHLRTQGFEYVTHRAGNGRRSPRINNGRRSRVNADTRERIKRAARRNLTLAGAAREAGVDPATIENVLHDEAPLLLRRLRQPKPAGVLDAWAGDLSKLPGTVREWGLVNEADYDLMVDDYGTEFVQSLVDRFSADITAISALRRQLRKALERQQARARREASR